MDVIARSKDLHEVNAASRVTDDIRGRLDREDERASRAPAPASNVPCPCTLIEQDEDCPTSYPSMICGVCKGTGNTTPEMVTALACKMIKIASDMGEPEDPFAAWETIDLIKSQHGQLRAALSRIAGLPRLAMQDAWQNSRDMRDIAIAALATTEGQP